MAYSIGQVITRQGPPKERLGGIPASTRVLCLYIVYSEQS
jgi:hypothetical protein